MVPSPCIEAAARCWAPPRAMAVRLLAVLRIAAPRALVPVLVPSSRPRCCTPGSEQGDAAELLAMGFSQAQARRLLLLQPGLEPQRRVDTAAQLLLLGLSAEAALGLMERSPKLLRMGSAQLKERAGYLRRLGLEGARLQSLTGRCPEVLTLPRRRMEAVVRLLRERCLFTAEQLAELLRSCPRVLLEEPGRVQLHFQYAYFRMGVRHKEMVKARLFCTPFAELRNRHIFLERRGLYRTPHKGQSQSDNPALRDVLRPDDGDFVAGTARATSQEYEVFKRLLAREEEEQEMEEEEDEEEDEEEEEGSAALHAHGDDKDLPSTEPSRAAPRPPPAH
ncbi:transcription termination factor 4, mitochondrial [Coturnix japonica]|uniref:transcription termination factor 4, mitochondrial n=1 Tax=Coturnix japonica TaxID=93934 RepID=UPI0007773151|nr:transcription termination factor 4, mitochondrial [Coturnix japonica]